MRNYKDFNKWISGEYELSRNFKLKEFNVSDQYPKLIKKTWEYHEFLSLKLLVQMILQPLRNSFGKTIILSGIRNTELNSKLGGSKDSDHLYGLAADLQVHSKDNFVVFEAMKKRIFPYRQLIYYPKKNFIHVSINSPLKPNKNEELIYDGEGYVKFDEHKHLYIKKEGEKNG